MFAPRKIVASVSVLAMMIGVVPQVSAAGPFTDVAETNEFATFIQDLKDQGIVSGVGETGMFFPLRNVSRGEMMKMVVNAMQKSVAGRGSLEVMVNVPMLPGAPHFSDVPAGSSFYNQVELGYALGIVQGRQAPTAGQQGVFGTDNAVLRQEAMKMIIRAYRVFSPETFVQDLTGGPSFDDVSTSSEFYDYIQTAYNLNMIKGYGNSKFGPMDPMRRDQMAKVVSNSMKVFREGKPLSVGVPAAVQVDNSDPQIKNDGTSTATITCTVVDRNGNRIGDWNQPLVFSTDAGTLRIVGTSEAAANTKTVSSDKGRGQITLISSTTSGTATVKCKTGTYEGTTRVEFTSAAPGIRNGFGSAAIAGVGELNVRITDDAIVASHEARPVGANSNANSTPDYSGSNAVVQPINGFATVEAFVYDDEGDPTCGDTLIFSIREGNGSLVRGSAAQGTTSVPAAPTSTAVRSLTLNDSDCVNGRYVAYLNVLNTQNAGDVEIQVLDRSTSPSLVTTATVSIDLVRLEAKVYGDSILTRNDNQNGFVPGNATSILIKTLDENDEPFLTSDRSASGVDASGEDDIECRFIGGPVESASLEGNDSTDSANGGTTIFARPIKGSAGLYFLGVIAGTNGGTLQIECRDVDSIGQPSVRFSVDVREPEVELFVSSDSMPEGSVSTVLARVTDGSKPIYAEQLRLTLDGGDSSLDDYNNGGYNRTDGRDSVTMDSICYNQNVNPENESILIGDGTSTGGGTVVIEPFVSGSDPCPVGYTASGWYTAKLFAPENVERDQSESLRVTDISRGTQPPEDSITVVSTTDNPSDIATIEVLPLRQEVGINQDIPTIIFAQDQDNIGLACSSSTGATFVANGEDSNDTESGCTDARNGYSVDNSDAISINSDEIIGGMLGTIVVNPTNTENVRLYAREQGTDDTNDYWILNNLGGGAYFMVAQAKDRADRGEWRIESYDSSGVAQDSGLVQVNIVPNHIEAEFNVADTIPDWNNTLIVFVTDENGDAVRTLESCRGGSAASSAAFPTNNYSDFVITRGGVDIQDVVSILDTDYSATTMDTNCSGGFDYTSLGEGGSGLYLFNVDTNNLVTEGTVTLTVSLNQATNPEADASYSIQDPTVELTAWPFSVTSSNIVPFTAIVRDDDGDPLDVDNATTDGIQVEIVDGSGNLAVNNATSVSGGLRVTLADSDDGVSVGSFRASSVSENIELTARVNTLSSRIEDTLTIAVD